MKQYNHSRSNRTVDILIQVYNVSYPLFLLSIIAAVAFGAWLVSLILKLMGV